MRRLLALALLAVTFLTISGCYANGDVGGDKGVHGGVEIGH